MSEQMTLARYKALSAAEREAFHARRRKRNEQISQQQKQVANRLRTSLAQSTAQVQGWLDELTAQMDASHDRQNERVTSSFRIYGPNGYVAQLVAGCYRFAGAVDELEVCDRTHRGLFFGESVITLCAPRALIDLHRSRMQMYLYALGA